MIAQPYDDSQNERQSSYAKTYGCEVLGVAGWGSAFNKMGGIPRHAALDDYFLTAYATEIHNLDAGNPPG